MTSLYARLANNKAGARALSAARLRYEVLKVLHRSLEAAKITQAELALRLGVRKSAVNQVMRGDGNVRINTLAEYLHELGFEVELQPVPVGKPREDAVRAMNAERQQLERGYSGGRVLPARYEGLESSATSAQPVFFTLRTGVGR